MLVIVLALIVILIHSQLTTVEQRKLVKLIDSNLVKSHLIAAGITSIVISYKRNC